MMATIDPQALQRHYDLAMRRAENRFAILGAALTRDLGLDVEPVVDQTGGMVMCLAIYWPDGAYVWFSDYWWHDDDFILGLYEGDPDGEDGTYPEPSDEVRGTLLSDDADPRDPLPPLFNAYQMADAISKWATPIIAEHGRKHGWERR
jgi:hypothetical protein